MCFSGITCALWCQALEEECSRLEQQLTTPPASSSPAAVWNGTDALPFQSMMDLQQMRQADLLMSRPPDLMQLHRGEEIAGLELGFNQEGMSVPHVQKGESSLAPVAPWDVGPVWEAAGSTGATTGQTTPLGSGTGRKRLPPAALFPAGPQWDSFERK